MERLPLSPDADSGSISDEDAGDLAARLPALREMSGFPAGTDDAVIAMSAPRAYTACPNPYLRDWLGEHPGSEENDRPNPGPFASDTTVGKSSLVYKAHNYPTKVPHEAIMRLILHYTQPGDLVLDGFCGTGMTGVAAQLCGAPDAELRNRIQTEMGRVQWGVRRSVLQDLAPSATFIAAGLNLPTNASKFDRASSELLRRFDDELGWMYATRDEHGEPARIDYTVWSEVFTCPRCGGEVVFFEAAFDQASGGVLSDFACPACGVALTKGALERRMVSMSTVAGDHIDRIEFRPVLLQCRAGRRVSAKQLDSADLEVLRRVRATQPAAFPRAELPISSMGHGSRLAPKGFTAIHHLWSDRALVAMSQLWAWTGEADDGGLRNALRFWIEQGFWGFSWMNRYVPTHYSHVNQFLSGVYYIPSLHAEPSPWYNLEGSTPSRGKRQALVRLWSGHRVDAKNVRISTGSSSAIDLPDSSVDYIFVDPPFGANIPYADLALVVEHWHGVLTKVGPEAVQDDKRGKDLGEYAALMEACFREFHRVLKPGRWMTVEFSNSSNAVWIAIQQAIDAAGFVVADTRVFDKSQHSFRQLTATNAVKRDLIVSAYKPAGQLELRVRLAQGSEEGVWAFVDEHLAHLPVREGTPDDPKIVRERQADRLYDRMVAYHVAHEIGVPMTSGEFYAALERRYPVRDGMCFLPQQVEEWESFRARSRELEPSGLFITGESSAVRWLRDIIRDRPRPFSEIQPAYFAETQKGTDAWEELPDLGELLEQNFVLDEAKRWTIPDPTKAHHLEQLRQRELLKEFEVYRYGRGPLERFRTEAVRAGFKDAYHRRDFAAIIAVGGRLPTEAFAEDVALLHYFRNAERMAA